MVKLLPKETIDRRHRPDSPTKLFISGVARDRAPLCKQEFDINSGQMRQSLPIPERYLPDAARRKGTYQRHPR